MTKNKIITKILFLFIIYTHSLLSEDFATKFNYYKTYEEAKLNAKKFNKDIVMVISSDYCSWCRKLEDEVLSLEYTNEILHKNYIPLFVQNRGNYPSKFYTSIVPTIHFISYKDESIIETIIGFNNNWRFYEIIESKQ